MDTNCCTAPHGRSSGHQLQKQGAVGGCFFTTGSLCTKLHLPALSGIFWRIFCMPNSNFDLTQCQLTLSLPHFFCLDSNCHRCTSFKPMIYSLCCYCAQSNCDYHSTVRAVPGKPFWGVCSFISQQQFERFVPPTNRTLMPCACLASPQTHHEVMKTRNNRPLLNQCCVLLDVNDLWAVTKFPARNIR